MTRKKDIDDTILRAIGAACVEQYQVVQAENGDLKRVPIKAEFTPIKF